MKHKIEERLLYINEEVQIWDFKLEKVLAEGKFVGINDFGNAILQQSNGEVKEVHDGRMRKKE